MSRSDNAWTDLAEAIGILAKHGDPVSPFNCSHDELRVMADPAYFTAEELARLDELGFHADPGNENFYSFRYGSA